MALDVAAARFGPVRSMTCEVATGRAVRDERDGLRRGRPVRYQGTLLARPLMQSIDHRLRSSLSDFEPDERVHVGEGRHRLSLGQAKPHYAYLHLQRREEEGAAILETVAPDSPVTASSRSSPAGWMQFAWQ